MVTNSLNGGLIMKNKNGINNLSLDLQKKLSLFDQASKSSNVSSFLTWTEFSTIFTNTTLVFPLAYGTTNFELMNCGNKSVLTIDYNNAENDLIFNYTSAQNLLDNALINNKPLKDIWNDVIID